MRMFLLFVHHVRALLLLATAVAVVAGLGCNGVGECACGADDNEGGPDNPVVPGGCGGSYESVVIGGQKWMKKNLNIQTANSWCYENSADSCVKYGRLYTWSAAKTVCPTGWHLPSRGEWDSLARFVGGTKDYSNESDDHHWANAGKYLKASTGWNVFSGIENLDAYGFSALPGGGRHYRDGSFDYVGNAGGWWTATESGDRQSYIRVMFYDDESVREDSDNKDGGCAVRCVAN